MFGVVDHASGVGIQRIRTGLDSPADARSVTDERFEYEKGRLVTARSNDALGKGALRYNYDCDVTK